MSDLASIILLVLALFMLQLFLQETTRYGFSLRAIIGNRDKVVPLSIIAGRFERAKNNLAEALPLFLGIAMLDLTILPEPSRAAFGALVFLIARVIYIPAYLSGIPMLRSLIWLGANAGLLLMVYPLV